jgi:nucleotide-binding universal stress UspA family protein
VTRHGPVLLAFDGSPAALRALREGAALLAPRRALVVHVWEAGAAFDLASLPTAEFELPRTHVELGTAAEVESTRHDEARRLAERGAALACDAGLDAEGLAVADAQAVPDTLVRLARDVDAAAIVVGAHGHGPLRELVLGSTTRSVMRDAPCPVVVVGGPAGPGAPSDPGAAGDAEV